MNRKKLVRQGEFNLEKVVLDVLLEAKDKENCLGPAAISKRSGIFQGSVKVKSMMHDAIVTGILIKLFDKGKVERCTQPNGRGCWKLTDAEFQRIRKED